MDAAIYLSGKLKPEKVKILFTSILLTFLVLCGWSQPRPQKLSRSVIIDTDCGIDDFRALSIILSRPEIKIIGIITSDGSLSPSAGSDKVAALLGQFNRKDIRVAQGETIKGVNPPWREFNMNISWGTTDSVQNQHTDATGYLLEELTRGGEKVSIVCLGPLTNLAKVLKKDAAVLSGIDRVIWYNDSHNLNSGFNYECDRKSVNMVLGSGIRVDIISNLNADDSFFDTQLAELSGRSETLLAMTLNSVFIQPVVVQRFKENHFRLNDDLVAVYLFAPELFSVTRDMERRNVRYNSEYDVHSVREVISDMISGNYFPGGNIVLNGFPVNREMFTYDVRPLIDSAIARYGMEEWKANVMTDEFHGHLGVFSIVGAKMGIKARELFDAGPDMLDVITFAGSRPPYSCLNDGIQVSTGATLGMGTIHLSPDTVVKPSAIFTFGNRAVRITLKQEYLEQIDRDINEGIVKFGLLDDGYWKLIRHNALKYWLDWDRDVIFDIDEVPHE